MMPGGSCDGAGSATACAVPSTSDSKGAGTVQGTSSSAAIMKKGPWTAAEDAILMEYVRKHGEGNWNAVQKNSGLSRCGKSCRLRWANHLRPNLKKGPFSPDEERFILELHAKFGNKWARMAAQLPGRTDNEIKNYWNTRIKRRQRAGLPLYPPDIQHQASALHHRSSTTGLAPSPTSDHKPFYSTNIGATPLSLFNPVNFAAPGPGAATATTTTTTTSHPFLGLGQHLPFLAPSSQRPKRFRDDGTGGFSLPFTPTNPVAPPPLSHNPFFPFTSLSAFDLSPPPPQQQHQQQQLPHGFPVKTELPSNQFFHEPSRAITSDVGLPLRRSNCELLDALLRDTHPALGGGNDGDGSDEPAHEPGDWLPSESAFADVKWANGEDVGGVGELSRGLILGATGSKWDDADHRTSAGGDQQVKKKEAAADQGGAGRSVEDDDLSALLDLIPAVASSSAVTEGAAPREWYNCSDSGEVSNGQQSSGVTDDNVGLQHLASSTFAAPEEDHSWSIGSCRWKDMPSSC